MPTIIVEDGTGLQDANSYCDLDFANTYHELLGSDEWAGDPTSLENALIKASLAIDSMYGSKFNGYKNSVEQSLVWPRTAFADTSYLLRRSGEIPVELKRATALHALSVLNGRKAIPDAATPGLKRKKSKLDVLEKEEEYFEPQATSQFSGNGEIELLLAPLFRRTSTQTVTLVR